MRVGGTGIVGFVTDYGQPRVALDVGQDAVFFDNPDLPETHSEIALPLRIGTDLFGALDVQSIKANAFSQEDITFSPHWQTRLVSPFKMPALTSNYAKRLQVQRLLQNKWANSNGSSS